MAQLPAVSMADNGIPTDRSIASFASLPGRIAIQEAAVGTELSESELPDTVKANVRYIMEDDAIADEDSIEEEDEGASTATPSEAEESGARSGKHAGKGRVTASQEEIPVTWDSDPV